MCSMIGVGAGPFRRIGVAMIVALATSACAPAPPKRSASPAPLPPEAFAPPPAPAPTSLTEEAKPEPLPPMPKTAAALLAPYRQMGSVRLSALRALPPAEKEAFVREADAILRDPGPLAPLAPLLCALSDVWSPAAEAVAVRYLAHDDDLARSCARRDFAEHGLSRAALARDALPPDASAAGIASVAAAMSFSPDVDARELTRLCVGSTGDEEARWLCLAARTRAGDRAGRDELVRAVFEVAATARVGEVDVRIYRLIVELGTATPFRELAGIVDIQRSEPIVVCFDSFDQGLHTDGCRTTGRGASVGDMFATRAIHTLGLATSFPWHTRPLTPAQRAELKAKLRALPPAP